MMNRLAMSVQPDSARASMIAARERRELEVRGLCERGELPRAVALALELYGAEVMGFLAAACDRHDSVAEIYSELCQSLCEELVGFEWRSSLRTWMYAIARNARHRHHDRRRRADRLVPLSQAPDLPGRAATSVVVYKRTSMKERLALARAQLTVDERELLVLRVDRQLEWAEIAKIVRDGPDDDSPQMLARASAALRKRFERTIAKLKRIFVELDPPAQR